MRGLQESGAQFDRMDRGSSSNLPIELLHIDIERIYTLSPIQQKEVSEATGRRSNIQAHFAFNHDAERAHSAFELDATAADVGMRRLLQADDGGFGYRHSRLRRGLVIDQNIA